MPFKARKAVFDKLLEVADVASLSRDERIQSIKQSGDSLRRSRLIFLNYLPVITRLFHDYLPDCLAGLDDVEAGGQIAAVQAGDKAEVVQQPSVGGDDADVLQDVTYPQQPLPTTEAGKHALVAVA